MNLFTARGAWAGAIRGRQDLPLYTHAEVEVTVEDFMEGARRMDRSGDRRRRNHEAGLMARLEGKSLAECGKIWGVSREQARVILFHIGRAAGDVAHERSANGTVK